MDVLTQILAFVITVLVLVSIHEAGHFFVARWLNVKVLRFSIGFGRPMWRKVAKDGTEFLVSWIPLGGYVKLLDEREGKVAEVEIPFAFNRQPLWKRFLIVIAGAGMNIIFAIVGFWLMFSIGFETLRPVIGQVLPNTPAAMAGIQPHSEIIEFDHHPVTSWQEVMFALVERMGEPVSLDLSTRDEKTGAIKRYTVDLRRWKVDDLAPEPLPSFGLVPYSPPVKPIVSKVEEGGPAEKAGLHPGDLITAIDGVKMVLWADIAHHIQRHAGQTLKLTILRDHQPRVVSVTVARKFVLQGLRFVGRIGVQVDPVKFPPEFKRFEDYGVGGALVRSMSDTYRFYSFNFIVLKKLCLGQISLRSLGGPISIYKTADTAFREGVVTFLGFLSLISVMLAFVNVLPIPGLDGGHLLYFLVEAIMRRPLSVAVEVLTMRIGMTMLFLLMIGATLNDIMRLIN